MQFFFAKRPFGGCDGDKNNTARPFGDGRGKEKKNIGASIHIGQEIWRLPTVMPYAGFFLIILEN